MSSGASLVDIGKFLGNEVEQAAGPITQRVDTVIKRLDEIQAQLEELNRRLDALGPLFRFLARFTRR
jgi:hypothetical protein